MTDDHIELTRRQILASTGAIGLAGAGAGLGTSAYYNDEESFEANTLTAGNLDLTVDWEEHYAYPQLYGFPDPTEGLEHAVVRAEPGDDAYVGFPDPENPQVWVHEDDIAAYMANTAIEAFPDPDDDGQQEVSGTFDGEEFVYEPCVDGANLPEHLDPVEGLRTDNADTRAGEADGAAGAPLVNLDDVKPGDFGELTLSFHLCDNPGYIWLRVPDDEEGEARWGEAENGFTEPEAGADDSPEDPELAENIQTAWWYDPNGNNVIDESIGAVDVMIAVDTSGSLDGSDVTELETAANGLASDLDASADARVGGLSFGGGSIEDFTALADGPVSFSGLSANGDTPMPAALEIAAAELDANGRSGAETVVVLFTDGGPNYENGTYAAGGYSVGAGYTGANPNSTVDDSEMDETAAIAATIRDDHRVLAVGVDDDKAPTGREGESGVPQLSTYLRDEIAGSAADKFSAASAETVTNVLDAIVDAIATSETVFHRGTLAADLEMLSEGAGIPLDADLGDDFDEFEDPPTERACFQPGVTNYVGFAWWLPTDVGNEIQSDSVWFDLGFYAEQCRHNDGAGPVG